MTYFVTVSSCHTDSESIQTNYCKNMYVIMSTHSLIYIYIYNPPRNFHYKMLGVGVSIKLFFFIELKCSCFEGLTFYRELWFDMV